ncbi:D-aminopeptidase DppA. Metallo peptidase. MEROPS family M55 [Polaromonas sp. OV174]|uniref:M55 family metallopeptidase n=1 Tax=Polaromonas sp. OV174 TaxID=1855300 RepID=UPI0008E47C4E|nr:M55 family metallopeptidase [Polaromonas sp. OV174]SFB85126.1 D-aminopeptidase DppA. Metallo peptidase. MEROPS family M55 [Polaromonas sp. OV174]
MKVLISTDIEGVAGVFHPEQVRAGNPEYERARRLMANEANAAIAGAFDAGASEVLVNDSHGGFRNMPPDLLDPRAQAIMGKPRYLSMMSGVDEGVSAVCMIGYHSRAQGRGILAHTINGFAFTRVFLNERELGEAGIYGALAGEYGVPVVMASGDDVFIEEHRPLFPHATFVQTKRATGQNSGISLSPTQACEAIRAGAAAGVAAALLQHNTAPTLVASRTALPPEGAGLAWGGPAQRPTPLPFVLSGTIAVRIQTQSPALADLFCQWPALTRLDGNMISFEAPTVEAAVRMINCLSAMSTMLR